MVKFDLILIYCTTILLFYIFYIYSLIVYQSFDREISYLYSQILIDLLCLYKPEANDHSQPNQIAKKLDPFVRGH